MAAVSGFWRRLLVAFSDAAPSLRTIARTADGGRTRRLLLAFSDASPAFRPAATRLDHPEGYDQARAADRPEPLSHCADVVVDTDTRERQPLVLCLDTSSSMAGGPIQALNTALREWTEELHSDSFLSSTVEVAVVTFGGQGVTVWRGPRPLPPRTSASPFIRADLFEPPHLSAAGVTPMTEALKLSVRLVAARKAEHRETGVPYYRPSVLLVTDGMPTDSQGHPSNNWRELVPMLADQQQARRLRLYAIGMGGITNAGYEVLEALAPDFNARLPGFPFRELFQMISASAGVVQRDAGDDVHAEIFAHFKSAWEAS
ncbi:VWA domain-containing protein [Streptomyces luteolifulvus]|uniref:VWA domain-containing protein n=1 Tax=Streptomyces luteolifulvus TaxID=2615112 RepID=A0A6H9UX35_9ACTN|nr:VWA domain-containing protein [Streptomyces luteolifulvus]KAB1143470.1 VWA domain-containing protein [Streptomyces luteolifulvus]